MTADVTMNGASNGVGHASGSDVCIVGAGPAGLMLGSLLARFGISIEVLDERVDQTSTGRADGLQPKSLETFKMLRLGGDLFAKGARIYDICFWKSAKEGGMKREGRDVHYPPAVVDLLDPYILLVHQGMVEDIFVQDMRKRGIEVQRSHHFETFKAEEGAEYPLEITSKVGESQEITHAKYIIGCDGSRSKVRAGIPDSHPVGKSHESVWGVLDGEIDTDFPDLWSKSVIYSEEHGSILLIPRERNMTRFYVEIKSDGEGGSLRDKGQEFVMQRARAILAPYSVEWKTVEWFGNYQIGQRVANKFSDPQLRAFIAGDASHTHSPKAAQGMNTSMHDSWNLAWKLNLAVRGLAKPSLLESYELERKKIAQDLIDFDYEHANQIAGGDAKTLAENFRTNIGFISGIGVKYDQNILNLPTSGAKGELKEGCLPPPAKVTRYIDANPVDIQLDIPILGQFRTYIFASDAHKSMEFLKSLCDGISSPTSVIAQASQAASTSYAQKPRTTISDDDYIRPERYTTVSDLITFSLITTMEKSKIEIADLPPVLSKSAWTFYMDDVPELDTKKSLCTTKWVGDLDEGEVVVANIRPDGYVGAISRWDSKKTGSGDEAARWMNSYFNFLQVPAGSA